MADDGGRTPRRDPVLEVLRAAGAALLAGIGGIHLDLWLTGYRHIGTVGNLFLLQVVVSFLLAAAVMATRRWYVASAGAIFAVGTLVGYEAFRIWTLFDFHEVRTTAGFTGGALEVLAFVSLGGYAILAQERAATAGVGPPRAPADRPLDRKSGHLAAIGAVVALLLIGLVGVTAVPRHHAAATGGGQAGITIVIKNFAFVPADFTVRPGEVVRVENEDGVVHTLTAVPGSSPQGHFDTGELGSGASITFVAPTTPGAYQFRCTVHPFMKGTLTVS